MSVGMITPIRRSSSVTAQHPGTQAKDAIRPTVLEIVIVVCSGCRDHLQACLASLAQAPFSRGDMRVHVVDNASTDGTEEVARNSPLVHDYRRLPGNFGFSVANNVALRRLTGDLALLLNPDTELRPGVLDHMVKLMEDEPSIGAAGCRLVDRENRPDHNAKRGFPTPSAAVAHFADPVWRRLTGRASSYRNEDVPEHAEADVDAVSGAFMLVRRQVLDDVGLLDEGYWMYGEDLDWCYRIKRAGWRVVYDGRVTTLHVKGGASGQHRRLRQNLAFHRSMGRFYRKHEGGQSWLDPLVYGGILGKFALSVALSAAARVSVRARRRATIAGR